MNKPKRHRHTYVPVDVATLRGYAGVINAIARAILYWRVGQVLAGGRKR